MLCDLDKAQSSWHFHLNVSKHCFGSVGVHVFFEGRWRSSVGGSVRNAEHRSEDAEMI